MCSWISAELESSLLFNPKVSFQLLQVRITRNRRAYMIIMIRCMNVDEARGACQDFSRLRSVVSAYPQGAKGVSLCIRLNEL